VQEDGGIHKLTDHLFRSHAGQMVAVLCRKYGLEQLDVVLDLVQDSFEAALVHWRYNPLPDNPAAWLMQVAKNKAINHFKKESRFVPADSTGVAEQIGSQQTFQPEMEEAADAQLRLLLLCCQLDLPDRSQVVLTLHLLCGFGRTEISRALLMQAEAVKKTLFRAKNALKTQKTAFSQAAIYGEITRFDNARTVLYLLFNEGYKTSKGDEAIKYDLCYEAIRLSKLLLLHESAGEAENQALLALMFFNLARFPARLDESGHWCTLETQDRSLWNPTFIEEGYKYLRSATRSNLLTRYHIEAIIASMHCAAKTFGDTDWTAICYLYEQLEKVAPSPWVSLNKLAATSYITEPTECLRQLEILKRETVLSRNHILLMLEGDLWLRKNQPQKSMEAFEAALLVAGSAQDKRLIEKKLLLCQSSNN